MSSLVLAAEAVTECGVFDTACRSAETVGVDRIRELFLSMAAGVLQWVATWWTEVPSMAEPGDFGGKVRAYAVALSAALLMLGMIIQAARMIWMRRAAPLVEAITGLSTYVVVVGLAVPVTAGALLAGDAFAAWILDDEIDRQVASQVVLQLHTTPELGVVALLGLLSALAGVALAAAMMLREVSVLVLAATLPLAASGRLVPGLGNWLPSVLRWVLALVLWKPAAALVYAAGFQLMVADEPRSLLVGVVTLVLTVAALPALVSWFTPLSASAVGGLVGGVGMGATAAGARMTARGPTVAQQVAQIERDFGSPAGRQVPPPGAPSTTSLRPTGRPDPLWPLRHADVASAGPASGNGHGPAAAGVALARPTAPAPEAPGAPPTNGNGRHEATP